MNGNNTNPTPLGFFAVALFAWMISMPYAGWFGTDQLNTGAAHGVMWVAALPLGIVAILEFLKGRNFYGLFFGGFASYAMIHVVSEGPGASDPFVGWLLLFFGAYFVFLWLSGLKEAKAAMLVFLGTAVTFLLHALDNLFGIGALELVGGYTGVITGLLALYTACGQASDGKLPATT